jgi:hypothetical protein
VSSTDLPAYLHGSRCGKACWALAGVLGVALVLRLWGIDYGLPYVYWTDEYHEVMRAMELGAGGFNLDRTGKGGFYLLLFLEYGMFFVVAKVSGVVASAGEFAELFAQDPTVFYLLGRVTAAVFGCATVAFAYFVAKRAYGLGAGLLAALFMAVNLLHVDLSHRVGVDIPMTLFVTMALYFGVRIAEGGGRGDYILAGLCAALATTTKLPGIVVVVPLLIAHGYNVSGDPGAFRRFLTSPSVWVAVTLFAVVLIATNPGILFADDLLSIFAETGAESAEELHDGAVRPNLWLYYVEKILASTGWPLFVAFLGSAGYAIWKRKPADVMLLAFGAVTYIAISSTTSEKLYFPRYALPIVVVLSILAGRALAEALESFARARAAVAAFAVIAMIAWPLAQSIRFSYSLTLTDTRTLAKDWIDAHVPPNSKILIEGGKISATRTTVPLEESREALDQRTAYWKSVEPRQAEYLALKSRTQGKGGFDLELVRLDSVETLDEYTDRGVRYFVVRPEYFLSSRRSDAGSAALVRELRSRKHVRLLQRFDPGSGLRPGPIIEIYESQR